MIAAAITKLLSDNGFGSIDGVLFEDRLPNSPKEAIGVFSFETGDPILGLCPKRVQDFAPFSVHIRKLNQAAARDAAYAVYDFLDGRIGDSPSGFARFEEISVRYPFRIRRDMGEPQGVVYAVNGEAIIDLP